jgi:hypothetical protein
VTKSCARCGEEKSIDNFRMTSTTTDGKKYPRRHSYCTPCLNEYNRAYRASRGLKRSPYANKQADLRKHYDLSVPAAQDLLDAQYGMCAICMRSLTLGAIADGRENSDMDLVPGHIDHDHKTGAVRGVLCSDCNRGLGCFKDSTFSLEVAAQYLRESLP